MSIALTNLTHGSDPLVTIVAFDGYCHLLPSGSFLLFCEGDCNDDLVDPFDKAAVTFVPRCEPSGKSYKPLPTERIDSFVSKFVALIIAFFVVLRGLALVDVLLGGMAFNFAKALIATAFGADGIPG